MLALLTLALGVADVGIFPDLDGQVELQLPAFDRKTARVSHHARHGMLLLWAEDHAIRAYPARPDGSPVRDADRVELDGLPRGPAPPFSDTDGDGIPDDLDVAIGARKVALNAARYSQEYRQLPYPGGDVPREQGACTDTVVRALRNAGIDLQREIAEDIARARRVYAFVKSPNASIDHRRVKTLLPWFERHWARVDDKAPWRAGEVVFFDTFPSRPGPDHIGLVSDRPGPNGLPLVINNWDSGYRDGDMDLLPSVAVTHRFRPPARRGPRAAAKRP